MDDAREGETPVYPANAVHMVRTTQLAQLQLSAMADHKASILMGATFVIFTITLGQAHGAAVPLPLLILGVSAFFSAVFAVAAVLPATRTSRDSPLNLLFFGSFTQLGEDEYLEKLTERLKSEDSIYRTMGRDIYQNGTVLARKKYRFLGIAYRIFLAGLTASFIAFVVQYIRLAG
ncbi:MAG TPA: Pycsar system effector family protein [Allosphingosinicella sp.]|nr:Pycsar system effector family protein [Allosphingosinicella sp.]